MPVPDQVTVNLREQTPEGWTLRGFSAPYWDGVNFFRTAQPESEIRFNTSEPRFLRFQYRLEPPTTSLTAEVVLDGRSLGRYRFSKEKFEIFYPTAFISAGPHVFQLHYTCDDEPCKKLASQYHLEILLVSLEEYRKPVGLYVDQLSLNIPFSDWQFRGLSNLKFDGVNYFRTLDDSAPATILFPGALTLADLRYRSFSDNGSYRLFWGINGGSERQAIVEQQKLGKALPAKKFADQYLSLIQPSKIDRLEVRAECVDGGVSCFPIRIYFPRVTVLQAAENYSLFSTEHKVMATTLFILSLALLYWLLFGHLPRRGAERTGSDPHQPTKPLRNVD